ncbi:endothelin-converting enzyme homolog [Condylostylus longicornis]|uniref:endothelin-converting enzyme homolog n=1 Tax=Condylostylus longicornis TaxID=2530218 RepID=UPI00244E4A82|nr:endothelin-converting enzyme homolog [Condylostylus longicornis]
MTVDVTTRSLLGSSGGGFNDAINSKTTSITTGAANSITTNGTSNFIGGSGGGSCNTGGGIGGANHSASTTSLQKQLSFCNKNNNNLLKVDEIEVLESGGPGGINTINTGPGGNNIDPNEQQRIPKHHSAIGYICCAPCIWLKTSATVHKIAITTATLLVTSLLVASPILFLISTAPSQLPKDCYPDEEDCMPTVAPPPECKAQVCRLAAQSIQTRMNWKSDPCKTFKEFSCSSGQPDSLRTSKSSQEAVDLQMQQLLLHNTTTGPFRKLGRLYGSCLKQNTNCTSIQLVLEKLGGYLPIGALGPSTISNLMVKIYELGPTPLIDIYYDLSYGRHPHVLLIIDGSTTSAPILENKFRWMGPKAPPYRVKEAVPILLDDLLDSFLPSSLTYEQKISEKESISIFIEELNKLRVEHSRRGFWNSSVLYNTSSLNQKYPFLNWTALIPCNWTGPIVVRSSDYLRSVGELIEKHPTRVAHNSLLVLFALGILPQGHPDPFICTKATMWALPEVASAFFMAQFTENDIKDVKYRAEIIFDALKAHLKRAPSLKGAALVKLSQLKIQTNIWKGFTNMSEIIDQLDSLEISSDNWFENILNIYQRIKEIPENPEITTQVAYAYPIVAKIFYDALSHSIVVPLSVIEVPYFDSKLPPYLQYASVGVAIAKEILRAITKAFEDKAMRCVPLSVNIFSNYSRMDILIHSGGMQIAYHSLLSLTGPIKGMARLPGLSLTPTQIFFLVSAQELCAESDYTGIDTQSSDFGNILGWLIAQGGSATEVFKCPSGSMIHAQKTCNVL